MPDTLETPTKPRKPRNPRTPKPATQNGSILDATEQLVTVIYLPKNNRYLTYDRNSRMLPAGGLRIAKEFNPATQKFDCLSLEPGLNQDIFLSKWQEYSNNKAVKTYMEETVPVIVVVPQTGKSLKGLSETYQSKDIPTVIRYCDDIDLLNRWKNLNAARAIAELIENRIYEIKHRGI